MYVNCFYQPYKLFNTFGETTNYESVRIYELRIGMNLRITNGMNLRITNRYESTNVYEITNNEL